LWGLLHNYINVIKSLNCTCKIGELCLNKAVILKKKNDKISELKNDLKKQNQE
jgi:hypothetical protein